MEQIEFLEAELKMMLDNIQRIKEYKGIHELEKWKPYNSNVVGELKHRGVSLKQRITLVSKITTRDLFCSK